MIPEPEDLRQARLVLLTRVTVFIAIAWVVWELAPLAMSLATNQLLVISALSTFAAGVIANAITVRAFETGRPSDFGLGWTGTSLRDFGMGVGTAAVAAVVVVLGPVAVGAAKFEAIERSDHPWASTVFVTIVLLFGAAGEEMMFHGYAFQLLARKVGAFATILPVSVVFGIAHTPNLNANLLGILNTVAWGVLLGYAYLRAQALWLPIGMHFGWNLALPLLGANLSGFRIGLTGYELRWNASDLWSGGAYGPEGGLLTTGIVIALIVAIHWLTRETEPETGDE